MKKHKKERLYEESFVVRNRVVIAAVAGALTGLAVTYLLESERGRTLLSQLANSVKGFAGNLNLPTILRS